MPRVYIPNRSGHDFGPARKYGDLIYMSEGSINVYAVAKMYKEFSKWLKKSTEDDYLLITSLTVMNVVAASILARKHGRINLLQYHCQSKTYRSRTIIIDELIGEVQSAREKS